MKPRTGRWCAAAIMVLQIAWAQGVTAQDAGLPIEITAEAFEVQQDNGIARFTGNVRAVQGDLILSADSVVVTYAPGADAIRAIEAAGNVFVSTAAETAQGDAGTYDVEHGIITLTGAVVLTRGENVVRGNRLVLNLATGLSRVEAGEGGDGGRVRGLFVPNDAAAGGAGR
ncbi:MAG: lipopolysaccharide transport periplasmic protein LptA [Proteobacteria bacterium]|nr:lipopolysaccharide transport periplasmic protein LptA [Pseudomonadota bacterium]MDA1132153.1 lipopolysaccharide transport periplasmic protein LptA [Pseudomonadota bacterium]